MKTPDGTQLKKLISGETVHKWLSGTEEIAFLDVWEVVKFGVAPPS